MVGTGVAGTTTATTLRQQGYDGRLVLVGDEPHLPYRRTALSKEVLQGGKQLDGVQLKPGTWWTEQQVEVLTGSTVTALSPGAVHVDGTALRTDAVVLATGGRARPLGQAPGAALLRTAEDAAALRPRLQPGARVLVVGAGFLGAEVAASAVGLGCEVTVLEAASAPLARVLPPVLGALYADLHRGRGVDLRLGVGLAATGPGTATDTAGATHPVDVLVVAVGQQPRTGLARAAGAAVRDGVLVDGCGRTSLPGVWAAGDAAAFPDRVTGLPRRLEHWHAAMTQGAAVARDLLGAPAPWTELPWAWSSQFGVDLQVCGDPRPGDDLVLRGSVASGAVTAVLARSGRLSGAVTVDRAADMRALRRLLVSAPETPLPALADESVDLAQLAAAPVG